MPPVVSTSFGPLLWSLSSLDFERAHRKRALYFAKLDVKLVSHSAGGLKAQLSWTWRKRSKEEE